METPSEWWAWTDRWPDWSDAGRRVEIEVDGQVFAGELTADEEPGGDGAVFSLALDHGASRTFADNVRWRFAVTERKAPL